mmetsp:Transcript_18499/g.55515  ORF Transcript_18499/g.55515 Transcript_18499/m.55515 type:complete len:302 (+) Transcript_18499:971-1876(+)
MSCKRSRDGGVAWEHTHSRLGVGDDNHRSAAVDRNVDRPIADTTPVAEDRELTRCHVHQDAEVALLGDFAPASLGVGAQFVERVAHRGAAVERVQHLDGVRRRVVIHQNTQHGLTGSLGHTHTVARGGIAHVELDVPDVALHLEAETTDHSQHAHGQLAQLVLTDVRHRGLGGPREAIRIHLKLVVGLAVLLVATGAQQRKAGHIRRARRGDGRRRELVTDQTLQLGAQRGQRREQRDQQLKADRQRSTAMFGGLLLGQPPQILQAGSTDPLEHRLEKRLSLRAAVVQRVRRRRQGSGRSG